MTVMDLEAALPELAGLGVPLLLHAEDPSRLHPISGDPRIYARLPGVASPGMRGGGSREAVALAARTGGQIHVLHVSSGDAADVLREAGPGVSAETCPHYLTFTAEQIGLGPPSSSVPLRSGPGPSRGALGSARRRHARHDRLRSFTVATGAQGSRERGFRRGLGRHQLVADPTSGNLDRGEPAWLRARSSRRMAFYAPRPVLPDSTGKGPSRWERTQISWCGTPTVSPK